MSLKSNSPELCPQASLELREIFRPQKRTPPFCATHRDKANRLIVVPPPYQIHPHWTLFLQRVPSRHGQHFCLGTVTGTARASDCTETKATAVSNFAVQAVDAIVLQPLQAVNTTPNHGRQRTCLDFPE